MDSTNSGQNLVELIHTIYTQETEEFQAGMDIIKNEVAPQIDEALAAIARAIDEINSGKETQKSRLDLIAQNPQLLPSTFNSPICLSQLRKANNFYRLADDELEALRTFLNEAKTSYSNMITFDTQGDSYIQQYITCTHYNINANDQTEQE